MTTQRDNRLTPQEEFNRLPPLVRDRLIAFSKHRKIEAAAEAIGCDRGTMRDTLKSHGDILYRLALANDSRNDPA